MATNKQIAANRRNALKSTGPRTPACKQRSSMNALRRGCAAQPRDRNFAKQTQFHLNACGINRIAPTLPSNPEPGGRNQPAH